MDLGLCLGGGAGLSGSGSVSRWWGWSEWIWVMSRWWAGLSGSGSCLGGGAGLSGSGSCLGGGLV